MKEEVGYIYISLADGTYTADQKYRIKIGKTKHTVSERNHQIEKKDQQIKFYGSMSFHGIEVSKEIDAQSVIDSKKLSFKGVFDLYLSDFGVPLPSFMMRKMEDEVVIKYELNFQKLER